MCRVRLWREAAVASLIWLLPVDPANAAIQVDCDTPDDFCVGDPCTTADVIEVTVASCNLNFGSRTLVIRNKIEVPNNGALSLTAGAIEVKGKVDGKHTTSTAGDGADLSFAASGDIVVARRIDASGRFSSGSIALDAGGGVVLRHQLRSRAKGSGATASGGSVSVQADGTISSIKRGKVDVRGRREHTPAGQVTITAQGDLTLLGRIEARGSSGGIVAINSATGDVSIEEEVRLQGSPGQSGSVSIAAAGDLTVGGKKGKVTGSGGLAEVSMTAGGIASISRVKLTAVGLPAGTVALTAGTVAAATLIARGKTTGGVIEVESTVGDVIVDKLDVGVATHGAQGGRIAIDAAANAEIQQAQADGGDFGGEMRFAAVQDLTLGVSIGSKFRAGGNVVGGAIEGQAGGDLTAVGDFIAAAGGCIGLSTGGTLDTSAATFDVPLSGSCP